MSSGLTIEPAGSKELEQCNCCGGTTRRIWGYAHRGGTTQASYCVEWTPGKVLEHGASFDLILGRWGEGAGREDRVAVSLAFRQMPEGSQFMVVDAAGRPTAQSDLAGRVLARAQVLDTPTAQTAFDVVDAIWLQDARIAELVARAG